MNDWLLGEFAIEPHGVDQKMTRRGRQLLNRVQHGEARSLVDIDLIDAGRIDGGNCPGDAMLADAERKFFAALGGKQLGIAQPANAVGRIENHCGSDDRAKERSAADFIDSGHVLRARRPRPAFQN